MWSEANHRSILSGRAPVRNSLLPSLLLCIQEQRLVLTISWLCVYIPELSALHFFLTVSHAVLMKHV